MRRSFAVTGAVAVVLGAGAVVALVNGGSEHPAATRQSALASSAPLPVDQAQLGTAAAGAAGGSAAVADMGAAPLAPTEPRVVKTATLALTVRTNARVAQATAEANHIAESHGGYVASSDSFKGEHRQTTLTLRVPVAAYDEALAKLRALGKVADESLTGKDVTGTLVDLEARLRSLRAQESALNALVARARTVGETLQVAQAAAQVHMQVEQLAGQQAQLADQTDFATIKLHIAGPNVAFDSVAKSDPLLVTSLRRSVAGTLAVVGGAIVVVGYALPIAALLALAYVARRLTSARSAVAQPR